ncbi:MAG: FG-GAP repeat protein [Acidobacteria bacterium]|nr:FG-GAP repeat protein [Acidobacteriota bacterium]
MTFFSKTRKDNSVVMVRRTGWARLVVGVLGLLSGGATVAGQCEPGAMFLDVTFDAGNGPRSIASGDLDGDGLNDFVVGALNIRISFARPQV